MTTLPSELNRQVVPRWRPSLTSIALGHTGSATSLTRAAPDLERELERKWREFDETGGLAYAADLVATGLIARQPGSVEKAAKFVLDSSASSAAARRMAIAALGDKVLSPNVDEETASDDTASSTVRLARQIISRQPRNALVWNDMARAYAVLGQFDKARKAMRVALAIAPDTRLLLRSASRMHLEEGDADEAHDLLVRSPRLKTDPWLMAAEIAAADKAGRHPLSTRSARQPLEERDIDPLHLAELASAMGTLEFGSGSARRGRQFFRQSLEAPTDNAVAQAQWAVEHLAISDLEVPLGTPFSFEARAHALAELGSWKEALMEGHRWFHDEPFSLAAALFNSWLASTALEDFETAERVAKLGLIVHPNDEMLLNNLAFALAGQDRVEEASKTLERIGLDSVDAEQRPFILATAGLIAYRAGDYEVGRRLYRDASQTASGLLAPRVRALAALYSAREELRLGTDLSKELAKAALAAAESVEAPEVDVVESRLRVQL